MSSIAFVISVFFSCSDEDKNSGDTKISTDNQKINTRNPPPKMQNQQAGANQKIAGLSKSSG